MTERARLGRYSPRALAAFGGFMAALALPPWGWWPLAFVGVTAFAYASDAVEGHRAQAWNGFWFALPWLFMGMGWMWFLTPPGYVAAGLIFTAFHAAAAALAPAGPWRVIGRPAAHTLAEIVRLSFPFGGVPLATFGISQAGGPFLTVARVGGVILLTWLVFQLGAVAGSVVPNIAAFATRRFDDVQVEPLATGALATVAVVVAIAAGSPSGSDIDAEPMRVAAVQGGGEQGTSALDVPASVVFERHLAATAGIEPDIDLDLLVWPENGVDVNRQPFAGSAQQQAIAAQADRLGVPVAVGVTVDSEFSEFPVDGRFVNAQVIVTEDGEVTSVYEKVQIVPFGEYVPYRGLFEAVGAPVDQIPSDAIAGRGPATIELPDGTELGVMISWEVFFGDRGRAASDGAILLNPTNGASYTGTVLQTQQVASSRLRAMETGRWVVQVSPTGFSAFVSPSGEVLQRTDVGERAVIIANVPRREGTTVYSRLGDLPWTLAPVLALGMAWWFGPLRPRERRDELELAPA